jgi:hypothetical protein
MLKFDVRAEAIDEPYGEALKVNPKVILDGLVVAMLVGVGTVAAEVSSTILVEVM